MPPTTQTLTIELPSETVAALRAEAEARGQDVATVAAEAVTQRYGVASTVAEEDRLWWESLTEAERQGEIAALKKSTADADAGRVRSAEDVYARLRAKYPTPVAADKAT